MICVRYIFLLYVACFRQRCVYANQTKEETIVKKLIISATLLAIAGAGFAELQAGDVILIVGRGNTAADGTKVSTYDGQTWNQVLMKKAGSTNGDLMKAADGLDSGATITTDVVANLTRNNGGQNGVLPANLDWVTANAPDECAALGRNGGTFSFTISGLNTDLKYNIDFAVEYNSDLYDGQTVDINGTSLAYSPYDHSVNGYEVSWTSVELNGSNELVVTLTGDAGKRPAFGMMRIEAVASVGQPAVLFIIK